MKLIHRTSYRSVYSILFFSICLLITSPAMGHEPVEQRLTLREQLGQFSTRDEMKSFLKKKNLKKSHLKRLDIQKDSSEEENDLEPNSNDKLNGKIFLYSEMQMPIMRSTRTNVAATSDEALTHHNSRLLTEGIPAQFDWSKQVQLSSVKSIGYCAASWAFSAAAFFEADSIINLNQTSTIDLSEQYLISCDSISYGCSSGFLQGPIDLTIRKGGIPTEVNYTYNPLRSVPRSICMTTNFFKTTNKYRMSYYDMYDQEKIKKVILKKPVSIAMCGQDFLRYAPGLTEESKILKCRPSNTLLNHAALLVGYTQKYWIIKNSWGQKWGIKGYAYISRNPIEDCCIGEEMHTTGDRTTNCSVQGCDICVEQYTCYKCQTGKYVYHDPFTGVESCKTCNITNCKECFDYYEYCSYCIDGYAINDTSGNCDKSPIQNCNHIVNGYCVQCQRGFLLNKEMTKCVPDCSVKYCKLCANGPCTTCLPGYSLTTVNGSQKCQPNICNVTNCDLCDTNGTCVQCAQYKILNGTSCINTCKIANCLSCKDGNYTWMCDVCADGKSFNYWFEVCESFNVTNCGIHLFGNCYQCKPGYQFESSSRKACTQICDVENCLTCKLTDTTFCLTCKPGYSLSMVGSDYVCTTLPCNIPNCTACNQNQTSCLVCKTEYHVYNATSNACEIQCSKANCEICLNSAASCYKCKPGYVVEYDSGTCYAANFTHCTLVGFDTGNFECWECEAGFKVDIVKWNRCLIACFDLNCEICDLTTLLVCEKCFDGFSQTLVNGKLTCTQIPSLIPKCKLSSLNQTYCFKCADYYYWDNTTISCLPYSTNCPVLCDYCPAPGSDSSYCQCEKGMAFDVFSNSCGINPFDDNCLWIGTYAGSTICFLCAEGYVQSIDYKACVSDCVSPNCKTCFATSNQFCTVCNAGFYVNASFLCQSCRISNCKLCDTRICYQCMVGFQLSSDGSKCLPYVCEGDLTFNGFSCSCPIGTYFANDSCVSCQSNCKWCDVDGCIQCEAGFFKQNAQCVSCIANCKECSSQTDCKLCNDKFFYEQTSMKCTSVGFNRTFIVVDGKSAQCLPGCTECNVNGSCSLCAPGYSLSPLTNECVPCEGKCKTCYFNIPQACLSCDIGYYFDELKCLPCANTNCIECLTDQNVCTKCAVGFRVQNKTCINCPNDCLDCNYKGECLKCSPGFSLSDLRTCEKCIGDCKRCNVYHLDQCVVNCELGEYLGQDSTCKACPLRCKTCLAETNCSKCQIGYILKNDMCISPCQQGCYRCSGQSPQTCEECFAGYSLSSNNNCLPDLSCNSTKNCIGCPQGWALQNKICNPCTTGSNCTQCSATNLSRCLLCADGFYLSNKKCSPCPSQCTLCQKENRCTKCSEGFYLIGIESDESGRCAPCDPKCKACEIRPNQCLSCVNQTYELTVSQKCIRRERVEVELTIDIDIELFSSIAAEVRESLAACIGQDYKNRTDLVIIKSISNGSTKLNSQLAAPEDQDLVTVLENVKDALASLTEIGGVSIISVSKVKILGSSDQPINNGTNLNGSPSTENHVLAIVLGVTLPSVVIIILTVVGCYLKKKRDENSNAVINQDSFTDSSLSQKQKAKNEKKRVNNKKLPPISTVKKPQSTQLFRQTPDEKSNQNLYRNFSNQNVEKVTNPFDLTGINNKEDQNSDLNIIAYQNDSSHVVLRDGQEEVYSNGFKPGNEKEDNFEAKITQNGEIKLQSSHTNSLSFNERSPDIQQSKEQESNVLEVDDV